ncbi:MAG: hypothetical protein WAV25_00855 [Minisyncoccia bacterium]
MKVPYSIQGLIFAPVLIGLVFLLKITCPVGAGQGCFADNFLTPVFMPIKFFYRAFQGHESYLALHEPFFILGYWAIVGLVVGLCVDLFRNCSR